MQKLKVNDAKLRCQTTAVYHKTLSPKDRIFPGLTKIVIQTNLDRILPTYIPPPYAAFNVTLITGINNYELKEKVELPAK